MFGYERVWHRGYTSWRQPPPTATEGYAYIGPCKCGFGPHAFYQDKSGEIVLTSQIHRGGILPILTRENLQAEVNWLKAEEAELEKRIRELEKRLKKEE